MAGTAVTREKHDGADGAVDAFIAAVRGRYRLYGALTVLVAVTTAAAVWVLGEVVADRVFVLQMHHRLFLLRVMEVAILSLGAAMTVGFFLRSRGALRVAWWVERRYPHLKNGMISLLELRRKGELAGDEAELARLIGDRVGTQVETLDPEEVIGLEELSLGLKALGLVFAVALLYSLVSWNTVTISLSRVLFPWERTPPPTSTRISELVPGNARVLKNAAFPVRARMRGVVPESAQLHVSEDGRNWRSLPMRRSTDRWWDRQMPGLSRGVRYQITAGDTRSDVYTITVVEPPLVSSVMVDVTPPAYSGMASFSSDTGSVTALAGSGIRITARTNKPAGRASGGEPAAHLVMGARRIPMGHAPGGGLSAEIVLEKTSSYHVEFADEWGHRNENPVEYSLSALPDEPPTIEITSPRGEIELPPAGRLALTARAGDDFGLAGVTLRFQAGFRPWESAMLAELRGRTEATVKGGLDLAPLKLEPGSTVTYFLTAEDTRTPQANSTDSARRTVRIRAPLPWERPAEEAPPSQPEPEAPQPPEAAEATPAEGKAAAEEAPEAAASADELAEALRKLARKLKEPEGDLPEADRQAQARQLEELARELERLADELDSGGKKTEPGGGEPSEYSRVELPPEGAESPGEAPGEQAQGAEAPGEESSDATGSGTTGGGRSQQAGGGESPGGEGTSSGRQGSGQGSGSSGSGTTGGQAGQGSGSGSGRGRSGGRPGSQSGLGSGGGGGSTSGGAATSGSPREGGSAGEGGQAPPSAGQQLRGAARSAREAAERIRRGDPADAETKLLDRLADELSGFGRRLRQGELNELSRRALSRRGEAADEPAEPAAPPDERPEGASASEGPLGPAERSRSKVAAAEERRADEPGRTPEDVSRLSPEFRRLYEAYTKSVSE